MDAEQLREHVIRPVLRNMDWHSTESETLLLGIACVESDCGRHIVQQGGGLALGIYQMEPDTYHDTWSYITEQREPLARKISANWLASEVANEQELKGNLFLSTALCRAHFLRFEEPIPKRSGDKRFTEWVRELAEYWKRFWNSHKGAGEISEFINKFRRYTLSQKDG